MKLVAMGRTLEYVELVVAWGVGAGGATIHTLEHVHGCPFLGTSIICSELHFSECFKLNISPFLWSQRI